MSPRIPNTHAEAWDLLPWLANGRIQAADREWLEAHVHGCNECRAELASQRLLATNMRETPGTASDTQSDEQRSFDKLWSRVEASERASISGGEPGASSPRRNPGAIRWLAAAVIVQGIGLALFGFNALRSSPAGGELHTVTSVHDSQDHSPSLSIVFAPDASIGTINTLLSQQRLSIVSGPGLSGNFTAALSADAIAAGASPESVAAVISRNPHVAFAQPITR